MKSILLLCSVLFLSTGLRAQFLDNNFIYVNAGLSGGNYIGATLSLSHIYKEKLIFQLGYSDFLRNARSQPDDYEGGVIDALLWGTLSPTDQLRSYEFMMGKVKVLNQKGTTRLNLKAGLSYTQVIEPINFKRVDMSFLGPNYSFEYGLRNSVGILVNPELEFPFSRFFGLSVSPFLSLGNQHTNVGIGFKTMAGILRNRIKVEN
jgi:hypothetical protein